MPAVKAQSAPRILRGGNLSQGQVQWAGNRNPFSPVVRDGREGSEIGYHGEKGRLVVEADDGTVVTGSVRHVGCCVVALDPEAEWAFASEHRDVIDAHWGQAQAENPSFFNGAIFLMKDIDVADDVFTASFVKTDFKSFLYWKSCGFPEAGVWDGFGSALLRSAEGHVVLGRQTLGHINSGLTYLPGGFIDQRDVGADGSIDISASIAREVKEETGLDASEMDLQPGFYLTRLGRQISVAAEYRSHLPADDLRARMLAHIAGEKEPELAEVVIVTRPPDVGDEAFAAYARVLLGQVL